VKYYDLRSNKIVLLNLLLLLCLLFSFHASVLRVYYTLFRSAYLFNFDLGVPDDIGRIQGIPAVKKVKNHCSSGIEAYLSGQPASFSALTLLVGSTDL